MSRIAHVLPEMQASDDVYAMVEKSFNEAERVALTLAIGVINTWNRIAFGFRSVPPNDCTARGSHCRFTCGAVA